MVCVMISKLTKFILCVFCCICLSLFKVRLHTILLLQPNSRTESRTFSDFECLDECMKAVCLIYEDFLKKQNPDVTKITYNITELFTFMDHVYDISCLMYNNRLNAYLPYSKDWMKERLLEMYQSPDQSAGGSC